nr:hydroxyacylglutathione hydrolase [Pararhodospirillum oryzae]
MAHTDANRTGAPVQPLVIVPLPVLSDNYAFLLFCPDKREAAVIDPGDAPVVLAALQARRLTLKLILNTHHHHDHTGANLAVQAATGCAIAGFGPDRARLPGLTRPLDAGATIPLGAGQLHLIETPGHTTGHVAYYCPEAGALLSGDCLFSMGCGRLFEGTPADMWASLSRLRALPDETLVYCGHEYTEANLRFALSVDPGNPALRAHAHAVHALRAAGQPSVPARLGTEKAANPFLRADDPALQRVLGLEGHDPVAVFASLRQHKDRF